MLYIVHRDQVASAATGFTPALNTRWLPGQIIHFSTSHSLLEKGMRHALMFAKSGEGWHIEILPPVLSRYETAHPAAVTVRLLRPLKADHETLSMVLAYAFGQRSTAAPSPAGALQQPAVHHLLAASGHAA